MQLKDTISLMLSDNWQDRFIAEYLQTHIRYNKLCEMIALRSVGKTDFDTPIPLASWEDQAHYMDEYLYELERQALIHGIELPKV